MPASSKTPAASPGEPLPLAVARGWDQFWFTPADPSTLAAIRILAGMLTFYVHLTYSWDLLGYIGPNAWVDAETSRYIRREVPYWSNGSWWDDQGHPAGTGNYVWSVFFHVQDEPTIIALHVFFLACMLSFAVGFLTPYTGLLTWIGAMSYVQRASSTVFGLDTMMMITLLYLQIGPSGATWSVDRCLEEWWARRKGEEPPPVEPSVAANFAIRLIQVHFAFIYFASGTSKLLGSTWWNGTALNLVMLNPRFTPIDSPVYFGALKLLAQSRWAWEFVMSVSIIATLLLEVSFIFLVWDMRWRWLLLTGSVGLHLGIGYIMGLTTFSLMMMAMVIAFYPPEILKSIVAEMTRSLRWVATGDKADAPASTRELAGVR